MTEIHGAAFLFDMDGTLVDSTALVEAVWAEFAERRSIVLDELLAFAHGRPTLATLRHFLGADFVADDRAVAEELARLAETERTVIGAPIVEIAGAAKLLGALPEDAWALVTSADRQLAADRMGAAGLPMPTVLVGSDDVSRGKPDPEGFRSAAAQLGFADAMGDVVIWEDSPAGVQAAFAAGAGVVVVGTGLTDDAVSELRGESTAPWWRVPDYSALRGVTVHGATNVRLIAEFRTA